MTSRSLGDVIKRSLRICIYFAIPWIVVLCVLVATRWGCGAMCLALPVSAVLILLAYLSLEIPAMRSQWRTFMWLRNRRCAACGYDLRASPDRCPECGTPVAK